MDYYKTTFFTRANVADITKGDIDCIVANKDCDMPEDQKDLMKIVSVLLSTGINKNDDVFLGEEIYPARSTGAHKPLNVEHDSNRIVGHMLRTYLTDKDGHMISDDAMQCSSDFHPSGSMMISKNMPHDFDVTSESVVYKYALPEVAKWVYAKHAKGELFVSVEVWFTDYDYLVGSKLVKRNAETSSVLDGCLRINGGDGTYKGARVGRVLRNMLIGGIGLTEHPANPESVIKSISFDAPQDTVSDDLIINNIIGNFASVSSELEEIMDPMISEEIEALVQATKAYWMSKSETIISQSTAKVSQENVEQIKKMEDKIAALESQNKEMADRLAQQEIEETLKIRKEILGTMKFSDEVVMKTLLPQCASMTHEDFDKFVVTLSTIVADLSSKVSISESDTGQQDNVAVLDNPDQVKDVTDQTKEPELVQDPENEPEPEPEKIADVVPDTIVDLDTIKPVDKDLNIDTDTGKDGILDRFSDILNRILGK